MSIGGKWALSVSMFPPDEFRGYALLQAAREADLFRLKKHLSLETINFKHPQTHETALVQCSKNSFTGAITVAVWVFFIPVAVYQYLFIILLNFFSVFCVTIWN